MLSGRRGDTHLPLTYTGKDLEDGGDHTDLLALWVFLDTEQKHKQGDFWNHNGSVDSYFFMLHFHPT